MKCTKCYGSGKIYSEAWNDDVDRQTDNGCIDYPTAIERATRRNPPIICPKCNGTGEEP